MSCVPSKPTDSNTTQKQCQNCQHWIQREGQKNFGICEEVSMVECIDQNNDHLIDPRRMYSWGSTLSTGAEFGCNRFTLKNEIRASSVFVSASEQSVRPLTTEEESEVALSKRPSPFHCPKCHSKGQWRHGVPFEHEMICLQCSPSESWEPK